MVLNNFEPFIKIKVEGRERTRGLLHEYNKNYLDSVCCEGRFIILLIKIKKTVSCLRAYSHHKGFDSQCILKTKRGEW